MLETETLARCCVKFGNYYLCTYIHEVFFFFFFFRYIMTDLHLLTPRGKWRRTPKGERGKQVKQHPLPFK